MNGSIVYYNKNTKRVYDFAEMSSTDLLRINTILLDVLTSLDELYDQSFRGSGDVTEAKKRLPPVVKKLERLLEILKDSRR